MDGAPVTATAAAFGYSRPSYYQAAAALAESGLDGLVPARPGPRGGHKLTEQILAWAEQQLAADPALKAAGLADPIAAEFGCACTPAPSSERWPAAGSTPKAADPSARGREQEENPSLPLLTSPGPAAAEPDTRPNAGQDCAPGGGLDARYEQLRHAALHARASAFPLGLGVLTGKGITAWRRALAHLTPATHPDSTRTSAGAAAATRPQAVLPEPVTTELIHALAGLAVALAVT